MDDVGVVYVAYGRNAVTEAKKSIYSLRKYHDWPVSVIGDEIAGTQHIGFTSQGMAGRWAKVNLLNLSLYKYTLFLDADTRVRDRLDIGFRALADGWDLVIVPSKVRSLYHLNKKERLVTLDEIGNDFPVMLNTGVMWFGRSGRMKALFERWQAEWQRFKRHDQGALLRALAKSPARVWLLGRDYNGGEIVEHLFGRAK